MLPTPQLAWLDLTVWWEGRVVEQAHCSQAEVRTFGHLLVGLYKELRVLQHTRGGGNPFLEVVHTSRVTFSFRPCPIISSSFRASWLHCKNSSLTVGWNVGTSSSG